MKKRYLPLNAAVIFICGLVLQISYEVSDRAPWSILVSSINDSPWELTKPFLLVYIMWSFIEMSYMRPKLLKYVCSRILSMHMMLMLSCASLFMLRDIVYAPWIIFVCIFICIFLSELLEHILYNSSLRLELFFVPVIISFCVLFGCMLFCSFYPPDFVFFKVNSSL